MNTQDTNNTPAITLLNQIMFFAAQMKQHLEKVKQLEEQITAIQNSNNQLAEIAFDENKFTRELMDRVDETAREAARDTIDIDDIASEVANNIDISEDVQRAVERLDLIDEDKVSEMLDDYINSNSILNASEVDEAIEEYIDMNCDFAEKDYVEDKVRDVVNELVDERTENIARRTAEDVLERKVEDVVLHAIDQVIDDRMKELQDRIITAIVNKLTAKENNHATDNHEADHSVYVSGIEGQSQAAGMLNASA